MATSFVGRSTPVGAVTCDSLRAKRPSPRGGALPRASRLELLPCPLPRVSGSGCPRCRKSPRISSTIYRKLSPLATRGRERWVDQFLFGKGAGSGKLAGAQGEAERRRFPSAALMGWASEPRNILGASENNCNECSPVAEIAWSVAPRAVGHSLTVSNARRYAGSPWRAFLGEP